MSRTVQEIYDKAIHLIDAQNETTGDTDTADAREYRVRACELLNTLLNECYPCSDTYAQALVSSNGRRPVLSPVSSMTDVVEMDDYICLSVLPAGLAALFIFDEDQTKYNAYWGDYMNRLNQARATLPASDGFEDIENPYYGGCDNCGIEHGRYSRWGL